MESLLEAIGNTPLLKLGKSLPQGCAEVYAKLEKYNPGGSVKDRVVIHLLEKAEKNSQNLLKSARGTIVAATTGNSGIGLAYIGNRKGYKVILTMPENFSVERRKLLESYGATVFLTPASEGMKGALDRAKELCQKTDAYFFDQFENEETPKAHASTIKEIQNDLGKPIDVFVAGIGTSGTLMGAAHVLKKTGTKIVAVEPAASPTLSQGRVGHHRIQGIGPGFVPIILDRTLVDEVITVTDEDAFNATQEIARTEGLLVGISCGAAFVASRKIAAQIGKDKTIVTVFPDGGERYFSLQKSL